MISKSTRQINLYYHPDYPLSRKCLAIAEANKAIVYPIDISKTKISQTDWSDMARKLNVSVVDLINIEHEAITSKFGKVPELDEFSALKIIEKHPEVVEKPIAIRGNKIIRAKQANDLLKLQNTDTGEIRIP
jgi:arsenate reductase-like glutaredoxin family protein